MGADMITGIVAKRREDQIDFRAGHEFLDKLKHKDIDIDSLIDVSLPEDEPYFDEEDKPNYEAIIEWLHDGVSQFGNALNGRATNSVLIRDLEVFITGEMSWGDVSDEIRCFWLVGSVPGLLTAMGFEENWDKVDTSVTPDEEAAAIQSIKKGSA